MVPLSQDPQTDAPRLLTRPHSACPFLTRSAAPLSSPQQEEQTTATIVPNYITRVWENRTMPTWCARSVVPAAIGVWPRCRDQDGCWGQTTADRRHRSSCAARNHATARATSDRCPEGPELRPQRALNAQMDGRIVSGQGATTSLCRSDPLLGDLDIPGLPLVPTNMKPSWARNSGRNRCRKMARARGHRRRHQPTEDRT